MLDSIRRTKLGYRIRLFFTRVRIYAFGNGENWARVVMDRATRSYIGNLDYRTLRALEISGTVWQRFGFQTYRYTKYAEYDWCSGPLDETFDVVIAEQVLEHVADPRAALLNAHAMLRPGGLLLITTPFLVRVHAMPNDCTRWTPAGLELLLKQCGFREVETGSWGNRACVRGNFNEWVSYVPWRHSLRNEPAFPVSVWAFARA